MRPRRTPRRRAVLRRTPHSSTPPLGPARRASAGLARRPADSIRGAGGAAHWCSSCARRVTDRQRPHLHVEALRGFATLRAERSCILQGSDLQCSAKLGSCRHTSSLVPRQTAVISRSGDRPSLRQSSTRWCRPGHADRPEHGRGAARPRLAAWGGSAVIGARSSASRSSGSKFVSR